MEPRPRLVLWNCTQTKEHLFDQPCAKLYQRNTLLCQYDVGGFFQIIGGLEIVAQYDTTKALHIKRAHEVHFQGRLRRFADTGATATQLTIERLFFRSISRIRKISI